MKKILISLGIATAVGLVAFSVWSWDNGKLFFRVPAKITLNGTDSNTSAVYKSGNDNYFIILDRNGAPQSTYEQTAYWVGEGRIGVPDGIVPSVSTLSFQTRYFLVCLDATTDLVGTGWNGVDAKWSVSSEEMSFQVGNDNVKVKL